MRTFLRVIGILVVLGVIGLLAFIFVPVSRTAPNTDLAADWQPQPGQGKRVALEADCVACHTAPGGTPFAGGLAIKSAMGDIWSSNITPDKETGIGNWTLDDFRAALVDGLDDEGKHLYPAMPYENFRFMKEEDIRALYSYFMNDVAPAKSDVPETHLSFPFNMRFAIRAWNWVALRHPATFTTAEKSETEDRGQYLVEGPGHCAACHSPRTAFMTQGGVKLGDAEFLAGGVIGGWNAPALIGAESAPQKWSVAEMANYLSTGRNAHSTANGEMADVVNNSLQYLAAADVTAIAAFLKGMNGGAVDLPDAAITSAEATSHAMEPLPADAAGQKTATALTDASPDLPIGARLYLDNCVACHFASGKGAPEIFPELQGNSLVTGSEVAPLIAIILNGAEVKGTEKRPMNLVMQGYADRLNDQEVAELASFVRTAWGNDASAVTAADVAKIRAIAAAH